VIQSAIEWCEPQETQCVGDIEKHRLRPVMVFESDAVTKTADVSKSSRCTQHCGGMGTKLIVGALGVAASDSQNIADAMSGVLDAWHHAPFRCFAGVCEPSTFAAAG